MARVDLRIKLAGIFIATAFVASMVGIMLTEIGSEEKSVFVVTLALFSLISIFGLVGLREREHEALMFALLVVYLWVAFPGKFLFMVSAPQMSWVSGPDFFGSDAILRDLPAIWLQVLPGILALLLGFVAAFTARYKDDDAAAVVPRAIGFSLAIASLLVLRVFCQKFLAIGLPGVRPMPLPVPYLVGLLALLVGPVLLAASNLFFYSALRCRNWGATLIAGCFVILNVYLGLRVGYKTELVFEALLIGYFLFAAKRFLSARQYRVFGMFAIISLLAAMTIYPFINYYRSYLLSGYDVSKAIEGAQKAQARSAAPMGVELINRVNGIDAFYVATKLGANAEFGIDSLVNSDVMDLFMKRLYGTHKEDAITAFGATQYASFYLIGGVGGLVLGCFVVGGAIRWWAYFLTKYIFKFPDTFTAYLPLYVIVWVKMLSAGGLGLLYIKEMLLVVGSLVLFERVFLRAAGRTHVVQRKAYSAQIFDLRHQAEFSDLRRPE